MLETLVFPFFLSLFVNLWSTIVGGGGAVVIPTLIFLGFSPQSAIATNRFASLSNLFGLFEFHRQGQVKWKLGLFLAGFAGLGSLIGSFLLLHSNQVFVERGIGIIILLSLPMFFLKKNLGVVERHVNLTPLRQAGGGALMVFFGIIGGFFSATGVWFSYVYLLYYGLTFLQTAATRKLSGAAMIMLSLGVFIPAGVIHWGTGLSMLAGGAIGSTLSARFAGKLGNKWIRHLFLIVIAASAVRLLF